MVPDVASAEQSIYAALLLILCLISPSSLTNHQPRKCAVKGGSVGDKSFPDCTYRANLVQITLTKGVLLFRVVSNSTARGGAFTAFIPTTCVAVTWSQDRWKTNRCPSDGMFAHLGRCAVPGLSGQYRGRDLCQAPRTCSR